jgi:hypothetical protein
MSKITVALPTVPYASTFTGGTSAGSVKGEIDDMTGHVALSWLHVFSAPSDDGDPRSDREEDLSSRTRELRRRGSPPSLVRGFSFRLFLFPEWAAAPAAASPAAACAKTTRRSIGTTTVRKPAKFMREFMATGGDRRGP